MRKKWLTALVSVSAISIAVSGCSSSGSSSGSSGGSSGGSSSSSSGGGGTVKVGLITSVSGAAAAFYGQQGVMGAKARLAVYAKSQGKCASTKIDLTVADDTSTPQGALAAAQKLVQQDKVYAVLEDSALFFGASQYLTTQAKGTPVIGGGFDGSPQWNKTDNNLFPSAPLSEIGKPYVTLVKYLKSVGATKLAGVAQNSPSSAGNLKDTITAAKTVGLSSGYVNTSIPFGSTDVGPVVLGIKNSKSDALYMPTTSDLSGAIVAGLKQANYTPKVIVAATGYGSELLSSATGVAASQGVTFYSQFAPVELNTPATKELSTALTAQGGAGIPTVEEYQGWSMADLFLHGLEAAGCKASQSNFMSTLRKDKTWDDGGLLPLKADFTVAPPTQTCFYVIKLEGKKFVPQPNASPICGGFAK